MLTKYTTYCFFLLLMEKTGYLYTHYSSCIYSSLVIEEHDVSGCVRIAEKKEQESGSGG